MEKKAQAWGFDLLIAFMIFIGGIIVFYLYSLNFPNETENTINTLTYEGSVVANAVLSSGFPSDWNENNVVLLDVVLLYRHSVLSFDYALDRLGIYYFCVLFLIVRSRVVARDDATK